MSHWLNDENLELRKMLWLRHGCFVPALYGDDGEMQCHHHAIDFKRDSPELIESKLRAQPRKVEYIFQEKEKKMASKRAREKAAQAWCTPETKDKVMDPDLAEAFADILDSLCPESDENHVVLNARSIAIQEILDMLKEYEDDEVFAIERYCANYHELYGRANGKIIITEITLEI